MNPNIRTELLRLLDGRRVLRLEDLESGLCLEKRLAIDSPVAPQKQRWLAVFEALLSREASATRS